MRIYGPQDDRRVFRELERQLGSFPLVVAVETDTERVDLDRGFVKATVTFADDSELHLFEYVVLDNGEPVREDYRYHYQSGNGEQIRRWDTAPHHEDIESFPHHVHIQNEVQPSEPMSPDLVLIEIARYMGSEEPK